MSTTGQFSSKNPTIKRILKEASELAQQPSADYHAAPLEDDLFEWHFTLRGPPSPSAFDGGVYHGRIVLPPAYPLKPPSFRFLTPTGRFEVNREICLSISGHHEETWQPAWGIRTALVAIRSFMDTSASGQLGGMEATDDVRKRMARDSKSWKCSVCAKTNAEVMREQEEVVKEQGGEKKEELVPEGLRLQYRESPSTSNNKSVEKVQPNGDVNGPDTKLPNHNAESLSQEHRPASSNMQVEPPVAGTSAPQQTIRVPQRQEERVPAWIDKAIYGIVAALVFLVWKKFMS